MGYLVLVNPKADFNAFCIAILFYFLIRAPEQYLIERFDVVARMPMLAYGVILAFGSPRILRNFHPSVQEHRSISRRDDQGRRPDRQIREKWTMLWEKPISMALEDVITSQETIENVLEIRRIFRILLPIFSLTLASFITTMVTVAVFVIFLILEEKSLPNRFKAAFPESYERVRTIVSNSSEAISTYVISKAVVASGQALILGFLLWSFDIPGWFCLGFIAFMADWVPILGAILATMPPMMIALIVSTQPRHFVRNS